MQKIQRFELHMVQKQVQGEFKKDIPIFLSAEASYDVMNNPKECSLVSVSLKDRMSTIP